MNANEQKNYEADEGYFLTALYKQLDDISQKDGISVSDRDNFVKYLKQAQSYHQFSKPRQIYFKHAIRIAKYVKANPDLIQSDVQQALKYLSDRLSVSEEEYYDVSDDVSEIDEQFYDANTTFDAESGGSEEERYDLSDISLRDQTLKTHVDNFESKLDSYFDRRYEKTQESLRFCVDHPYKSMANPINRFKKDVGIFKIAKFLCLHGRQKDVEGLYEKYFKVDASDLDKRETLNQLMGDLYRLYDYIVKDHVFKRVLDTDELKQNDKLRENFETLHRLYLGSSPTGDGYQSISVDATAGPNKRLTNFYEALESKLGDYPHLFPEKGLETIKKECEQMKGPSKLRDLLALYAEKHELVKRRDLPDAKELKTRKRKRILTRVAKVIALFVGIGEGFVAAVLMGWPLAIAIPVIGLAGFSVNAYLMNDAARKTLFQLFVKQKCVDSQGNEVESVGLFIDANGKRVSKTKRAIIIGSFIFAIGTGFMYGCLSLVSTSTALTALGVAIGVAFPPALILGLSILIASTTLLAITALFFNSIADFVKNDRMKQAWNYLRRTFHQPGFRLMSKAGIKHVVKSVFNAVFILGSAALAVVYLITSMGMFHDKAMKACTGFFKISDHASTILTYVFVDGLASMVSLIFNVTNIVRVCDAIKNASYSSAKGMFNFLRHPKESVEACVSYCKNLSKNGMKFMYYMSLGFKKLFLYTAAVGNGVGQGEGMRDPAAVERFHTVINQPLKIASSHARVHHQLLQPGSAASEFFTDAAVFAGTVNSIKPNTDAVNASVEQATQRRDQVSVNLGEKEQHETTPFWTMNRKSHITGNRESFQAEPNSIPLVATVA